MEVFPSYPRREIQVVIVVYSKLFSYLILAVVVLIQRDPIVLDRMVYDTETFIRKRDNVVLMYFYLWCSKAKH